MNHFRFTTDWSFFFSEYLATLYCFTTHIPRHKRSLLASLSLPTDVLLLKLVLIQYITMQREALLLRIRLYKNTDETPTVKPSYFHNEWLRNRAKNLSHTFCAGIKNIFCLKADSGFIFVKPKRILKFVNMCFSYFYLSVGDCCIRM